MCFCIGFEIQQIESTYSDPQLHWKYSNIIYFLHRKLYFSLNSAGKQKKSNELHKQLPYPVQFNLMAVDFCLLNVQMRAHQQMLHVCA